MEINVEKIAKWEGQKINFDITDSERHYEIEFGGEKLKTVPPIYVKGTAVNYEGKIEVEMTITATVERRCSRCIELFTEDLEIFTRFNFVKKVEESDEECYLYKGDSIEITDLVLGEIAAELTMKPLCNSDCRGLCPVCGKNKNIHSCECKGQEIDSRLQILSKLLDTEQQGGV